MPAQQLGDFHLRQAVLAYQRMDDPRFFEL
jgi:hypothetical protein